MLNVILLSICSNCKIYSILYIVVNIFNSDYVLVTTATLETFMSYSHKLNDMIYISDNRKYFELQIECINEIEYLKYVKFYY